MRRLVTQEGPQDDSRKPVARQGAGRPRARGAARKARGESRTLSDSWFDLWLTIEGDALHDVAKPLLAGLDAQADAATHYKRGVTKRETLKERARIVIANLAHAVVRPPPSKRIAVSLMNGTKTRYDNALLRGDHLREIIGGLQAMGVAEVRKGAWAGPYKKGSVTTIAPTPEFAMEVEAHGVSAEDFGRLPGQEVLLLKRADPLRYIEDANDETGEEADPATIDINAGRQSRWVDYRDCATSIALRDQIMRLGEFTASADIRHVGTDERLLRGDCLLRRHFTQPPEERTPRWDLGGRLFYRRLSHLKRDYRRGLTINGSPVTELDFKSMFAALAYCLANTPTPQGDAYRWQGLEAHRSGVKMGFNAMLFGGGRGGKFGKDIRKALPRAMSPEAFREAFLSHHPALLPLTTTDAGGGLPIGYALMHTESRIMAAVLDRLMDRGVVAIGLHDGLIVGREHAALAKGIMVDAAAEVAGVSIGVEEKA